MMVGFNDVLESVKTVLLKKYPAEKVYLNYMPQKFDRPSFLLENTGSAVEGNSGGSVTFTVTLHIAAFDEVDNYFNSQLESLNVRQMAVIGLFASMFLRVGDRALHVESIKGGTGGRDWSDVTVVLSWDEDISEFESIEVLPTMETIKLKLEGKQA